MCFSHFIDDLLLTLSKNKKNWKHKKKRNIEKEKNYGKETTHFKIKLCKDFF
jgi:hypothetical protein